jgi:transcriptional regulator with XRE-family HTH domain
MHCQTMKKAMKRQRKGKEEHKMTTEAFGTRLRELRKAKGFALRDLAALTEVDFTYLSKLELGISPYSPSAWLIHELARNLEANEDELTNLAGKVPPELKEMMKGNPLLTQLVWLLSERVLPDETYRKMIELARSSLP